MVDPIRPIILCGGSGTRLWPVSREAFPKQFAPLIGQYSTFQETVLRVSDRSRFGKALVITNKAHCLLVERQVAEIGLEVDLLLEPIARDSAPAIIASSLSVAEQSPRALALVLAADHVVREPEAFRQSVAAGAGAARAGAIVTFGVRPTYPATGYGYIEPGAAIAPGVFRVKRFVEKPDQATAQTYLAQGLVWNSGNFLFDPETVIAEYGARDADSLAAIRAAFAGRHDVDGVPMLAEAAFLAARKISFDYAVMEKTAKAAVISGEFGWSDIGGWDALWQIAPQDGAGNVARGDVAFVDTRGSYASSEDQLVAVLGMTDTIIVSTADALLVADRRRAGDVRRLVETLKAAGRAEAVRHARILEPWGWQHVTESGPTFELRRFHLLAGHSTPRLCNPQAISNWTLLSGAAIATIDTGTRRLTAGEALAVPNGAPLSLACDGPNPCELIEARTFNAAE